MDGNVQRQRQSEFTRGFLLSLEFFLGFVICLGSFVCFVKFGLVVFFLFLGQEKKDMLMKNTGKGNFNICEGRNSNLCWWTLGCAHRKA